MRSYHFLLVALPLVFLATYQVFLADTYSYLGLRAITEDFTFWCFFGASMAAIFLVFPARIERPSDLFLFFYLLVSVLWLSVMWPATTLVSADEAVLLFAIIYFPTLAMITVRAATYHWIKDFVIPVQLGSQRHLLYALFCLLALGALLGYRAVGEGGLGWDDMYERRLAGRVAFKDDILAAYAVGMAANGALPLIGFFAGYRRSIGLAVIGVCFIVLMFFLLGLKSPAINFAGLTLLGFCFRTGWLRRGFVPLALSAIFAVYSVGLLLVLVDYKFIADILMRRISMVQPMLQSFYFDFWANGGLEAISPALVTQSHTRISYIIGELYLNNPATNANTNTFIYALARGGMTEYFFTVAMIVLIFLVMDTFYAKTKSVGFYAIAALFSVLISEQVWTTSLVTSGIALCLVLTMLFSYPAPSAARRKGPEIRSSDIRQQRAL
jgi:hypothetical protein